MPPTPDPLDPPESRRSVGRPSEYDPAYCAKVIELGRAGACKAEIAYELGVVRQTLENWAAEQPEFLDALTRAREMSLGWWSRLGRTGVLLGSKGFNAPAYQFQVRNRFRGEWDETTDEAKAARPPALEWLDKPPEEWSDGERLEYGRRSAFAVNGLLDKLLTRDALKPDGAGHLERLIEQVRARRAARATPVTVPPPASAAAAEKPAPWASARPTQAPTLVPTKLEPVHHIQSAGPDESGNMLVALTPVERTAIMRARQINATRQQEATDG